MKTKGKKHTSGVHIASKLTKTQPEVEKKVTNQKNKIFFISKKNFLWKSDKLIKLQFTTTTSTKASFQLPIDTIFHEIKFK